VRYAWKPKENDPVTIAVGILATDGIVVAADTQVGVTEYLKINRGKVAFGVQRSAQNGVSALAITGSGNSHYVEHLQHEFIDGPHPPVAKAQEYFSERMQQFYRDHIIPFAGYGPAERPDVSLILAAKHRKSQILLSTEKNTITEAYDCCAVGIGEMYARILLQRLYSPMDITSAIQLAAYVVFEVKEHVDGCGSDTDIVFLRDDGVYMADRDKVTALEELFRKYLRIEADLLHFIFSTKKDSDTDAPLVVAAEIRKLRRDVVKLLQSSKPTSSEISQA